MFQRPMAVVAVVAIAVGLLTGPAQASLVTLGTQAATNAVSPGQDLHARDLHGQRSPGSDYRDANLHHANLHHAVLHHSRFHRAVLHHANLRHADLRHAVFHKADLRYANLQHARMHHVVLGRSRMHHAVGHHADLRDASLRHATMHHVGFRKARMQRADFSHAGMRHALFRRAVLHRAVFVRVDADEADLQRVRARKARFDRATMPNVAFNGADLRSASLRNAQMPGADFSAPTGGSSLSSITPPCASTCTGADLTGADLSGANLAGADFAGADLSGASLRGANLTGANFTGADLRAADLTGADWTGATFIGALTEGTNFGSAAPPSTSTGHVTFCTSGHVASSTETVLSTGLIAASYSAMSSSGSGTAVINAPGGVLLDVTFQCDLSNGRVSWTGMTPVAVYPYTLTITGAHGAYTSLLTGMTVDNRSFTGTITGSASGTVTWAVTSAATYVTHGITMSGQFSVSDSRHWSLEVASGAGSVTTADGTYSLTSFNGSIAYASEQYTGDIVITAGGAHPWLNALPAAWTKAVRVEIGISSSGSNVVVQPSLEVMASTSTNGNVSSITLSAQLPNGADEGFRMTGSGQLYLRATPVTVSGWYQSAGYQGQAAPSWDIDGTFSANVGLGQDAHMVSGSLDINSSTPGVTGTAQVALAKGAGRAFTATLEYQNAASFTLTATGGSSGSWSPMPGLTIPAQAFSGTVTMVNGVASWDLNVGSAASPITWNNVATGVTLQAWYSVGNTCPLATCGNATGIFLASHAGTLTFTTPAFTAATSGAMMADGSWATFTASGLGTETFSGPNGGTVSLGGVSLTLWEGDAPHSPVSGLSMPDVNNSGSGVGVEFCGTFAATNVPYVGSTQPAQGCVSWSPSGIVLGVTNLGVSMPGGTATAASTGSSVSGVNISGGSIAGLGWTNLGSRPEVTISHTVLSLLPETTSLSGSVTLPGDVMAALGRPMQPTAIPATATFSDSSWTLEDASFSLTATVPLHYSSNGFALKDFFITAAKSGPSFSFAIGVDAAYHINDTTAPVTMSLGYSAAVLTLKLTATGSGGDSDACACDGVNAAFHTPEGYGYLSDSFMDVPGMHLWSITGQLMIKAGEPGFGLGATVYQDPRQMSTILHGSSWMQSRFYLNVDLIDPCFDFGFTSGDPGTYLQVKNGVLQTSTFRISLAPAAGCTVGSDAIPGGVVVSFASSFGGQGSFDFDLVFDPAAETFYESVDIANVTFGGITFFEGDLTIDLTPSAQTVDFQTDFDLPPSGSFTSTFDVSMNSSDMQFDGDVSMTDWDMAGGSFDVQTLGFHMAFDTAEGTFSSTANGTMKFSAKSSIAFTADIEYNNDALQQFDFDFQYTHGSSGFDYTLDYDAAAHTLSGGIELDYVKGTSHHFCSGCHTYTRHAYITISLDYLMNTANPSQASLSIAFSGASSDGDLKVSGGATLSTIAGTDDSAWASLHVHISGIGSWDDSWTW